PGRCDPDRDDLRVAGHRVHARAVPARAGLRGRAGHRHGDRRRGRGDELHHRPDQRPRRSASEVLMAALLETPSGPPTGAKTAGRRSFPGVALIKSTHGLQRGMLLAGLGVMALFVIIALLAPFLAPFGFNQVRMGDVRFGTLMRPNDITPWGTTVGGQDVLSRVIWGAQTALLVIVLAVIISLIIGVPLGLLSGYVGGKLDRVLVLVTDALYAFPSLLLAIVVSVMLTGGRSSAVGGIVSAALAITVVFVPQYFRVVRNATVSVKTEPYVDGARVIGTRPPRIMFRHVL